MKAKPRIVLPAYPVIKNVDGAAVESMFFQSRQLWQELANLDVSLKSDRRRDYNDAVALKGIIRAAKSRILELSKSVQWETGMALNEVRLELAERKKSLSDCTAQMREVRGRLGTHPSTMHEEMIVERRRQQKELMKASGLWRGHQEQILFRYEKSFASMQRRGKQCTPADTRDHASMLLFPNGVTTVADVLAGNVPHLWIQQPNDFELRSSSRIWRQPLEWPMLAEFRLGGDRNDWSFPVARLIFDAQKLMDGSIDPTMQVSLISLRRVSEWNLFVDIVLLDRLGEGIGARFDQRPNTQVQAQEQDDHLDSELAALSDSAHLAGSELSPDVLLPKFGRMKAAPVAALLSPRQG